MSILQYFTVIKKSRTDDQPCSLTVTLPDPRGPLLDKVPTAAITSANASYCLKGQSETSRKQKGQSSSISIILEALIATPRVSSTFNLSMLDSSYFQISCHTVMLIAIESPNDLMNLTIVNVWNEKPGCFLFYQLHKSEFIYRIF